MSSCWCATSSSLSLPNVIVPRHNEDTSEPVLPSVRYSMGNASVEWSVRLPADRTDMSAHPCHRFGVQSAVRLETWLQSGKSSGHFSTGTAPPTRRKRGSGWLTSRRRCTGCSSLPPALGKDRPTVGHDAADLVRGHGADRV